MGSCLATYFKPNEQGVRGTRYKRVPTDSTKTTYGSSDNIESKHYHDQMDIYKNFGVKKMSFDKSYNYKNAKRVYNPN